MLSGGREGEGGIKHGHPHPPCFNSAREDRAKDPFLMSTDTEEGPGGHTESFTIIAWAKARFLKQGH